MTSTDLTKAFDTVSQESLWKILAKRVCPEKFIAMVRQFHDGMFADVNDTESSEPFLVTDRIKQGCVLAPTLFNIMLSAMLTDAFRDCNAGVDICYWTKGKLFNWKKLKVKKKLQEVTVGDHLFAKDCSLDAKSEYDMQQSMDHFSSAWDKFGLTINTKKTEVMYQPPPGRPYIEATITVKGQTLQAVDKFTYLGSTLSHAVHIDDEMNASILQDVQFPTKLKRQIISK
ncbi:hypothetical protein Y1Q_0017935 [Alligator mississippiensis]|uniref:Reverse transcriptase domain-containing protein n=1 Tax=Alligator mississippiensis TaxID=8496 RepID=A0A151MXL2_ALLMI|nr:hypothetical protein Y1Q_0017935 [Alligator mississippiensis]